MSRTSGSAGSPISRKRRYPRDIGTVSVARSTFVGGILDSAMTVSDSPPWESAHAPGSDRAAGFAPGPRSPGEDGPAADELPSRPTLKPGSTSRSLVADARQFYSRIARSLAEPDVRRRSAKAAYGVVRNDTVRQQLNSMPLERLKETTQGRLRFTAIEKAGYRTVGAAANAGQYRLEHLNGVGPQTASRVIAAARQVEQAMKQTVRVRFDPDSRPAAQAKLLGELYLLDVAESSIAPLRAELAGIADRIDQVLGDATRAASRLRLFFSGAQRRDVARQALTLLDSLMAAPDLRAIRPKLDDAVAALGRPAPGVSDLWHDYEMRAVRYNGLLIEIGELAPGVEAGQGTSRPALLLVFASTRWTQRS